MLSQGSTVLHNLIKSLMNLSKHMLVHEKLHGDLKMENINKNLEVTFLSDYAVLLKKMRLLRKLNRKQAGLLLDFSFKNLERLENGRGNISTEKFREFQEKYCFSDSEIELLRTRKLEGSMDTGQIEKSQSNKKRANRRFCHRRISRECKVLKELRLLKNLDQYSASKLCGIGKNSIGFIENGRVTLTDKKIQHIVLIYGYSMEYFNQLLKVAPLRHEMIEEGQKILEKLDENKLRIILPMINSMHVNV